MESPRTIRLFQQSMDNLNRMLDLLSQVHRVVCVDMSTYGLPSETNEHNVNLSDAVIVIWLVEIDVSWICW